MKHPINILLVEDERSTVELVEEALKDSGIDYDLEVASDGEELMGMLQEGGRRPNIILLDLNLPKKSGIEVLREMKADPALRAIPVIVLTSSDSPDDVLRAYAAYCNAYIRKPLGIDALIEAIQSAAKFWFETATLPDPKGPLPSLPPKS